MRVSAMSVFQKQSPSFWEPTSVWDRSVHWTLQRGPCQFLWEAVLSVSTRSRERNAPLRDVTWHVCRFCCVANELPLRAQGQERALARRCAMQWLLTGVVGVRTPRSKQKTCTALTGFIPILEVNPNKTQLAPRVPTIWLARPMATVAGASFREHLRIKDSAC